MRLSIAVLPTLLAMVLAAPQVVSSSKARAAHRDARKVAHAEDINDSWAGAVISDTSATFKSVNTTFTIPTPKVPSNKDGTTGTEFTTSAWVGIDGYNCQNLWQAGVDFTATTTGDVSYYAWYEWYPADTQVIEIGTLEAGNVIDVSIVANSAKKGTVILKNVSTGKSFTKTVTSDKSLCLSSAEWVIEDVGANDLTAGVANIGTFTFEKAVASTTKKTLHPNSASLMEIKDDSNTQLTTSSVTSDSVVVKVI